MSFILEALKKSEQERKQQAPEPRRVRRRTLVLTRQGGESSRIPWLLAACLVAALAGGLWYFSVSTADTARQSSVPVVPVAKITPPQPAAPAPVTPDAAPVERSVAPPAERMPVAATVPVARDETPALAVEPAPVPIEAPPVVARPKPAPIKPKPAPTVAVVADPVAAPARPSLYSELSHDLRARMPALDMSMHFYTESPTRRLVRINNRLFREGDMVDTDLQLVEITPDGALLDFLGMLFEMRGRER